MNTFRRMCVIGVALVLTSSAARADDPKGFLGIYLASADGESAKNLNIEEGTGVLVLGVIPETAADGTLEEEDVIIALNGQQVENMESFVEAMQNTSPGDQVTLDLVREGKQISVEVTLGERKQRRMQIVRSLGVGGSGEGHMIMLGKGAKHRHHFGKLHEILEDVEGNQVTVKIECDDGEGTITVQTDGEEKVEFFDCSDMDEGFAWTDEHAVISPGIVRIQIPEIKVPEIDFEIPHIEWDAGDFDFDFDFELPDLEELKHRIHAVKIAGHSKPSTAFHVDPEGKISVTLRKAADELVQEYLNEDDLEARAPELYEKFMKLQEAMAAEED